MIPFKYLGYDVEIKGPISPLTSEVKFTFKNATDDNTHILKLNTSKDKLYHNVINKIKNSIRARLLYLQQQQD